MPTFGYIARDQTGRRLEGQLAGVSAQAILSELEARQLSPVRVAEVRERWRITHRVSVRRMATVYRQLSDLLRAGVPLLRALKLVSLNRSEPRLSEVFSQMADSVADGARFSDALTEHPEVFPPVHAAMVRAGEQGGFLESVLRRLGDVLEHQADLRAKVIGNLIYPVVLLVVGVAIVTIAMVVFVPRFRDFYTRIDLPWPTAVLLAASDLLTKYWLLVVLTVLCVGLVIWRLRRHPTVRRQMSIWQNRLPKIGPLVQSLAVARFTRILGTLLQNGVPMLFAMQISRDSTGHVLLGEAVDQASDQVRQGGSLADPLAKSGLFEEDVVEMIRIGEAANNLPEVLLGVAETIEKRVDRMLGVLVRLMEPALLLVLAGGILFIFVALIVPMMRLSSSLSG